MKHSIQCCGVRSTVARYLLAAAALAFSLGSTGALARPTQPSAADRQITLAVSMLMERQHLSGKPMDDMISQRCMETFIKELDPLKLFFFQSDVDEFMSNRNRLDDLFRRGDIRFAYDVFSRFLSRVDERINLAQEALG